MTCPKCAGDWDWPAHDSSGANTTTAAASGTDAPQRTKQASRSTSWFWSLGSRRRGTIILVCLGLAGFIAIRLLPRAPSYTPPKPLPGREADGPETTPVIWNAPPEQPLPDNGDGVFRFDRRAADSKLRIVPRSEQGHIVLKIEDANDSSFVCWFFIRQGESAEASIPAGSYRLKLACGTKWYGEEHLFGPNASYSAIASEIKIPTHTTYTIDLHPSTAGTLRETTIRPENF